MCEFYCVSYNSAERKRIMTDRFRALGLELNVNTGVQMDDPRLQFSEEPANKRLASCFYGHMDNIAAFYATGKPYGLFCEDDVHMHKDLAKELPTVIEEFDRMNLDILLLGYMTAFPIEWWTYGCPLVYDPAVPVPYRYHRYHKEMHGVHLYMITRSYARRLLDTYGPDYAARVHADPENLAPYNPDWTISKLTEARAIRYPMLAVEDGKGNYDHWGQGEYHRNCHKVNYIEGEFL
jgi:GR25 family glycosyltransferase involved in LPS biosynthesis